MFESWKSRAGLIALTAMTVGTSVVGLAGPAGAAEVGNSANAKLCQNGGWQTLVRADKTPFRNEGDCVSFLAHGGSLVAESASQLLCESYGGVFGKNDLNGVPGTLVWTCNGWPFSSLEQRNIQIAALFADCQADGGNRLDTSSISPSSGPGDSTCALSP